MIPAYSSYSWSFTPKGNPSSMTINESNVFPNNVWFESTTYHPAAIKQLSAMETLSLNSLIYKQVVSKMYITSKSEDLGDDITISLIGMLEKNDGKSRVHSISLRTPTVNTYVLSLEADIHNVDQSTSSYMITGRSTRIARDRAKAIMLNNLAMYDFKESNIHEARIKLLQEFSDQFLHKALAPEIDLFNANRNRVHEWLVKFLG